MSDDSYTEVTEESWFGRMGNAFKGFIGGLLIFLAAFPLLFWNEGRSVKRYKTLQAGAQMVVSVKSIDSVDPKNNNKLVHMTGEAKTKEIISDSSFGIADNALILKRDVEMYQWKEHKETKEEKKVGGGVRKVTTYSYQKVWSDTLIKSSKFKKRKGHYNPGSMRYEEKSFRAKNVTFGAFSLTPGIVDGINNFEKYEISKTSSVAKNRGAKLVDGLYYIGKNPDEPEIGDYRISYQVLRPQTISLISKQINATFEPYTMDTGELELVYPGTHSAKSMFTKAEEANRLLTWILRLVGFSMMFAGLMMMLKPISVTFDILPFLGNIAEMGLSVVSFIIAFAFSLLTIAIAWLFYRPFLSLILLVLVGGSVYGLQVLKKKKK